MMSDALQSLHSVFISGPSPPPGGPAAALALASLLLEQLLDHDTATVSHSLRVARLTARVAARLPGDPWRGREGEVYAAALLHDIGKLLVPLDILTGTRALTAVERACVRDHPYHGVSIMAGYTDAAACPLLCEAAWGHHEWWDGDARGYPRRLVGDAIPPIALLVSLCDSYDAMTSDRPYRRGLAPAVALAEVARGAGTQFDPQLVAAVLAHGLLSEE